MSRGEEMLNHQRKNFCCRIHFCCRSEANALDLTFPFLEVHFEKTYYGALKTLARPATHFCVVEDWNLLKTSLCMQYRGNISSIFSSNSEANASELLENLEEMFSRYLQWVSIIPWNLYLDMDEMFVVQLLLFQKRLSTLCRDVPLD